MAYSYQAGIADRPPEHVLIAALAFAQRDQPSALAALGGLRELVRRELAADLDEIDPDTNPAVPTADTGELGVDTGFDTANLTITLGISTAGAQVLSFSPQLVDLHPIDWAGFNDNPTNPNEGDLVLQICADNAYVTEHVLHRIEHALASSFTVVYTLAGEQRNGGGTDKQPLTADTARALIGFHDGLSNLNPTDPTDQQLIFVDPACTIPLPPPPPPGPQPQPGPGQPGYGQPTQPQPSFPQLRPVPTTPEPAWATGGSYLTVRASLLNQASWDTQTLQAQQQTIGRYKYSGATLDHPNEPAHRRDDPVFATNPTDTTVPLTSHLRRANPRALPTDQNRRILRRGYPIILPTATGTLQRGLLFLAYARTITTQTEFILAAWLKNPNFPSQNAGIDPLLQLETTVVAGGNYFVPAVHDPTQPWNWNLPGL